MLTRRFNKVEIEWCILDRILTVGIKIKHQNVNFNIVSLNFFLCNLYFTILSIYKLFDSP